MILLAILILLLAIQFMRPEPNKSKAIQYSDMMVRYNVPANVADVLKTSCYDCHSNNTRYPWYINIQPVGWLLAKHVRDGKDELNFNEFTSYSPRKQWSKLKSIRNSIKDGSMPLSSYTLLHADAKLSEESKALLIQWTNKTIDSLSAQREENR